MNYQRLTREERYQVFALLKSDRTIRQIAVLLRRSPSTISREIRRNRYPSCAYVPDLADENAKIRTRIKNERAVKIRGKLEIIVRDRINQDWSPEQIVGRLKQEKSPYKVSHETIYKAVYAWALKKGDVTWTHLRTQRKTRRSRAQTKSHIKDRIIGRVSISERPAVVEKRSRIGDYERDTLLGTFNTSVLLTIVERKCKYLHLRWLKRKTAVLAHQATVDALEDRLVHTITNDNGSEFSEHSETAKHLGAKIFFSRPYRPWERGTNENLNGLLRQYFPRNRDLSALTQEQINEVEEKLNNRPRKSLSFRTPKEIYRQSRSDVALAF